MNFKLPDLPYSYDALEPFFDKETMQIHHQKHHQAYIDNTNNALSELPNFSHYTILELVQKLNTVPENKKNMLRNNAGGHINHTLFWQYLKKGTILQGSLKDAIEYSFSSIPKFKEIFESVAMSRFGSGWIWLIKQHGILSIVSTANQDNPLMGIEISGTNGDPILGLDLWEHAYYLKYKNRRLDYIKSFWNIINWDEVSNQFNK